MAEEVVKPTMGEGTPKKEEPKKEVQEPNAEELVEILKTYDATDSDKLEGKLKAGTEVGQMAN
ncbi:unnamed protein product, partial [marine sediment metagenome]